MQANVESRNAAVNQDLQAELHSKKMIGGRESSGFGRKAFQRSFGPEARTGGASRPGLPKMESDEQSNASNDSQAFHKT